MTKGYKEFLRPLIAIVGVVVLVSACTADTDKDAGLKWTPEEKEASLHYFKAQRDNREASRISRTAGNRFSPEQAARVRQFTVSALEEAHKVSDSFLDKSHPKLKEQFHNQFIPALELALKNLDSPNYDAAKKSGELFSDFADWIQANQKDIRFPREK